jgi:hypothetical protein
MKYVCDYEGDYLDRSLMIRFVLSSLLLFEDLLIREREKEEIK